MMEEQSLQLCGGDVQGVAPVTPTDSVINHLKTPFMLKCNNIA